MDKDWFYPTLIIWLLFIFGNIMCQFENGPIGAHRLYEKTSFSCAGRSNGYYADIETGCQVYHMCDGLGRQFTYSCPNTTLFQQRMLICDHWYMVNCSKAESDYTANLLIGQRDKPFVPDDENQQRTPRPDLLDRPYAPDYSGESFRNQYSQIPPVPNQIDDSVQDNEFDNPPQNQHIQLNPPPSSTRWRITQPSSEILPPAIAPIVVGLRRMDEIDENGNIDLGTSFSSHYNTSGDTSSEDEKLTVLSTLPPTTTQFTTLPPSTTQSTTKITTRKTTVLQTRPTKPTESNIIAGNIKIPSKLYEPPFLYPIYNENYTTPDIQIKTEKYTTSTASPFIAVSTTSRPPLPPLTRPTTSAGRPFSPTIKSTTQMPTIFRISTIAQQSTESLEQAESSSSLRSNYNNYDFSRYITTTTPRPNTPTAQQQTQLLNDRQQKPVQPIVVRPLESAEEQQQETPSSEEQYYTENEPDIKKIVPNNLQPPIPHHVNDATSILDFNIPTINKLTLPSPFTNKYHQNSGIQQPPTELLPPFTKFIEYDTATTQGPPIYYEWKIPSNALEPPKSDPPIGVDGRLTPDYLLGDDSEIANPIENQNQQEIIENSSAQIDEHAVQEQQLQQGSFGKKIQQSNDQQLIAEQSEKSYSSSQSPQPLDNFPFAHNPFLSSLAIKSQRSVDSETRVSPTPRSISTRTNNNLNNKISTTRRPPTELEIQQLKRDLLVPDFLFPLEEVGRTGYEVSDTFNSFQLKIPKRKSDIKGKNWYGENIKCPECHPSFVKPGSCEPCVRKR